MCVWSRVLGGFWMGSLKGVGRKQLRTWSWRRELNPDPLITNQHDLENQ
jgi:hypothetical protein